MIAIRSWNLWLGRKPSKILLCPKHRELAELNLRGSGSSSAWCSAHNVSAAAGRMFEDPGPLRLLQPDPLEFGKRIKKASLFIADSLFGLTDFQSGVFLEST
jgi:hypothetical protein